MLLSIDKIYQCTSIPEALEYLAGDEMAVPFAAGTDILPVLRDQQMSNVRLVDLYGLRELSYIRYEDGMLRIGAMTTHDDIANSDIVKQYLPALAFACSQIGSLQIRKRATIGGNICHASPAADTLPVLIAAQACAVIRTGEYKKTILLEKFITGVRKTCLTPGALLEELTILVPEQGWKGAYYRIGGRNALTISIASVAVLYGEKRIQVAYGSMAPVIKRIRPVEKYLKSCEKADKNVLRVFVEQNLSPISDIRASREYRLDVAANLTWLGYTELMEQI